MTDQTPSHQHGDPQPEAPADSSPHQDAAVPAQPASVEATEPAVIALGPPGDAADPPRAEPEPRPPMASEIVVAEPRAAPPPPPPRPPSPPHAGRPQNSFFNLPLLSGIGFLVLVAAVVWLRNTQQEMQQQVAALSAAAPGSPGVALARVAALEARLGDVEKRLQTMESRPAAAKTAPPPSAETADTGAALATQVAALEQRLKDDEQRQATQADKSAVAQQVAALAQRVQDSESQQAALADKTAVAAQVDALEQRLKEDEQRLGAEAAKGAISQRLQLASLALDAGQPVGDVPGAPPALSRYAKTRPPTEAALRLAFPAAASAAEAASRPSADGKSLGERILMHASALLTIRQGDKVVVGAPATTVLRDAQAKLDAGDLGGAVASLDGLDSSAAKAMAAWRGEATALLDARAALAQMARS